MQNGIRTEGDYFNDDGLIAERERDLMELLFILHKLPMRLKHTLGLTKLICKTVAGTNKKVNTFS